MAWTTPRTWTTGEVPTAAQFNEQIRDNELFLYGPPTCRVYNNANLTIPNATETAVTLNAERRDPYAMHSTVTNTSRVTVPIDGFYEFGGHLSYDGASSTGYRSLLLKVNGSTVAQDERNAVTGGVATTVSLATAYELTAGQYIQMFAKQSSGGDLDTLYIAGAAPELWVIWRAGL